MAISPSANSGSPLLPRLGWIGEPAVALIEPTLGQFVPAGTIYLVSFALGFGFITFLHVVFGELAPKTFAIQEGTRIGTSYRSRRSKTPGSNAS